MTFCGGNSALVVGEKKSHEVKEKRGKIKKVSDRNSDAEENVRKGKREPGVA